MRHSTGTLRTEWPHGRVPMDRDVAEQLAATINERLPQGCFPPRHDRPEGAFATKHYGVQTVGIRGCSAYRREAGLLLTRLLIEEVR